MVTTPATVTVGSREGVVVVHAEGELRHGELRMDIETALQLADDLTIVAEKMRWQERNRL